MLIQISKDQKTIFENSCFTNSTEGAMTVNTESEIRLCFKSDLEKIENIQCETKLCLR